jgi:O-acetyl-ADP-ribose deacetylase (regulator of RNase III)
MQTFQKVPRRELRLRELFYISHIANVPSILKNGIFSHQNIVDRKIPYKPIYDEEIVSRRKEIRTPAGKSLWSYANLFFRARNPMLYRLNCEGLGEQIAVIGVSPRVMDLPGVYVANGNAAHSQSEIIPVSQQVISQILKDVNIEFWTDEDGSKRRIMAECLVPDSIPSNYIKSIYTASRESQSKVYQSLTPPSHHILICEPRLFFRPFRTISLTSNLTLALQGDMFFSRMQTITVSVNCVGIMGKGVASRAKYQFPRVYVYYQDLCRKHQLKIGRPVLFKREGSTDSELADNPSTLACANAETWFLLFPTKQHWRDDADISGIEEGLRWVCKNYRTEGIKSLAMPALGCGLGNLEWKDVGPILCKYLSALDIPVYLYLPAEKEIPEEMLTKKFLLPEKLL